MIHVRFTKQDKAVNENYPEDKDCKNEEDRFDQNDDQIKDRNNIADAL